MAERAKQSKTSIRQLMLFAMLALGLVPLFAVTLQSLHCAHEGILDLQRRQLSVYLQEQQARIHNWVAERVSTLKLVGDCPTIHRVLASGATDTAFAAMQRYLDRIVTISPAIESIAIYDTAWRELVRSSGSSHGRGELADPELRRLLATATDVVWTHQHTHGQADMGMHMGYAIPADTAGGGFLVANVRLAHAVKPITTATFGTTSAKVYLVSREDQRYLSLPAALSSQLGRPAQLPAALQTAASGPTALTRYSDLSGHMVYGMALPIVELEWLLVAEIDRSEALSLLYFLSRRSAYASAVVVLLIILTAAMAARWLGQPLQELSRVCRDVAGGATQRRIGAFATEEASDVADAFNSMLDQLERMQKQLVQAGALAAIGELSAAIVHEMRNPLNTIQINLDALQRKLSDEPNYRELCELASRQSARLHGMLNCLLNFGKPLELALAPVDLSVLTRHVLDTYVAAAAQKQVSLQMEPAAAASTISGDSEQLHQAIANLIDNALQAVPADGEIRITVERDGPMVTVTVADSGPGIPEAMRDKIFRPFFTTRTQGTGLGLATVKKIAELHHGSVTVGEASSGGAAVVLQLPALEAEV